MDLLIFIPVLIWLAIISWFDLRKSEIPHSAWVIVPFCLSILYRVASGTWSLVLLAVLIASISERALIAKYSRFSLIGQIKAWIPLLLPIVWCSIQFFPIATLAILAFWVAWELGWWGGADATTGITLFLIWPTVELFMLFGLVNLGAVIILSFFSIIREKRLKLHHLPGLPLLFLSLFLYHLSALCGPAISRWHFPL